MVFNILFYFHSIQKSKMAAMPIMLSDWLIFQKSSVMEYSLYDHLQCLWVFLFFVFIVDRKSKMETTTGQHF
jgi:hypothetical protein